MRLAEKSAHRRSLSKKICNLLLNKKRPMFRELEGRNFRLLNSKNVPLTPQQSGTKTNTTPRCNRHQPLGCPPVFCYLYLGPFSLGLVGGGGSSSFFCLSKSWGFSHVVSSGLAGLW